MAKPARAGRGLGRRSVIGATALDIEIRVCLGSERLAASEFDPELDLFRKPRQQRAALAEIAAELGSCVSAALNTGSRFGDEHSGDFHDQVIGYAAFQAQPVLLAGAPFAGARVVELGAIEVAPTFRRRGIARALLKASFSGGRFDDAVVFARLYAWHYDLGRTGLGPLAYRRFLRRLYASVGLEAVPARGHGDGAHGADLIMACRGPEASDASVEAFERQLGAHLPEA